MDFKDLPPQCPPAEARPAKESERIYRLGCLKDTYSPIDFRSHWERYPSKRSNYSSTPGECQAKSLSVFLSEDEAYKASKLPSLKSKVNSILSIKLEPTDGKLMQTGGNREHHSLWLSCAFVLDKANIQVTSL